MSETEGTVRKAPTDRDVKTSKVFRKAKKKLAYPGPSGWTGAKFICVAIFATNCPIKATCRAVDVIEDRLGGFDAAEGWLRAEGVNPKEMTADNLQAWRHAWLDQLIAEFEANGD